MGDKDDHDGFNDNDSGDDDGMPMLETIDEDENDDGDDDSDDEDDDDDEEDPLDVLDEAERESLMQNTAAVRNTLNKVHFHYYHCYRHC